MYFVRNYYEAHKKDFDLVGKTLKTIYIEFCKKNNSEKIKEELSKEELTKQSTDLAKYLEGECTYAIYENSYDPRAGYTIAVYLENPRFLFAKKSDFFDLIKKYFKNISVADKEIYKASNFMNQEKDRLDFVVSLDSSKQLDIIFNGSTAKDNAKYTKYMSKRPNNVIY